MLISSTPLVKAPLHGGDLGKLAPSALFILPQHYRATARRKHTRVCPHTPSRQHLVNLMHLAWDYQSYRSLWPCLYLPRLKYCHHTGSTMLSLRLCKWVLTLNPPQSWKTQILPRKLKGVVAVPNGDTFAFPIDDVAAGDKVFFTGFKTKQLVIIPVLICKTIKNHIMFAC